MTDTNSLSVSTPASVVACPYCRSRMFSSRIKETENVVEDCCLETDVLLYECGDCSALAKFIRPRPAGESR